VNASTVVCTATSTLIVPANASPGRPADRVRATGGAGWATRLPMRGRQLRLGPMAFWVVVGTLVIMAAWSITTATYFAFSEDVLTRLLARQARAAIRLRGPQLPSCAPGSTAIAGRQLIDQEQYEQKPRADSAPSGRLGSACERP